MAAAESTSAGAVARLLRVEVAADELSISSRHLRDLIARGCIRVVRIGKCVRVPRDEVERIIANGVSEQLPS